MVSQISKMSIFLFFIFYCCSNINDSSQKIEMKKECDFYIFKTYLNCYDDKEYLCDEHIDFSKIEKIYFDDNDCRNIRIEDLNKDIISQLRMVDKNYIPKFVTSFPNLKIIIILESSIKSVPKDFFALDKVKHLTLVNSVFNRDFFTQLNKFKNLEWLDISYTNLAKLPK